VSKIKLRYVQAYRDCRGKLRHYVRQRGKPNVPLPGLPGSPEFMEAYQSAIARDVHAPSASRHKEGTIGHLVVRFYRSAAFTNLAPSSQKAYRFILDKFARDDGHRLVRDMPKSVAASIIEEIGAARPGMANLTAATLKRLFTYAVKMDMRTDNPFIGIDTYEGGEHRAWTDREIAAYEAKWPIGTRQRLAFDLLLFTGQRVGDVAAMRRADLISGAIPVKQEKTGADLLLPVHPSLMRSLKACAADGPAPLNTDGRPMTKRSIADIVARAARSRLACRASARRMGCGRPLSPDSRNTAHRLTRFAQWGDTSRSARCSGTPNRSINRVWRAQLSGGCRVNETMTAVSNIAEVSV
jgi:enterobacteria phage integrase